MIIDLSLGVAHFGLSLGVTWLAGLLLVGGMQLDPSRLAMGMSLAVVRLGLSAGAARIDISLEAARLCPRLEECQHLVDAETHRERLH
jgi:hypothetical protein